MFVFLLDCLRFSKLLKLHQTKSRISSNLLKRKQENKHRVSLTGILERATLRKSVIRERASKVVFLAFSKLYYACVIDDNGDCTRS